MIQEFKEFINNPWVIGIASGIFSGFILWFIIWVFTSQKENKEYMQKVVTANHEILYAIRPGISEGKIPSQNIINSLITATAQKYNVDIRDIYNISDIINVLIKEVMDSSFLPASTKEEYCNKLIELIPKDAPISQDTKFKSNICRSYKYSMSYLIISMITMTMIYIILLYDKFKQYWITGFKYFPNADSVGILIALFSLTTTTILMFITIIYKKITIK